MDLDRLIFIYIVLATMSPHKNKRALNHRAHAPGAFFIFALFAQGVANGAISFHDSLATWRGAPGLTTPQTSWPLANELTDNLNNNAIPTLGVHTAVPTGPPYLPVSYTLGLTSMNQIAPGSTATYATGNDWRFGTSGRGIRVNIPAVPAGDPPIPYREEVVCFDFTSSGGTRAFAVTLHDLFDSSSGVNRLEILVNGVLALDTGPVNGFPNDQARTIAYSAMDAGMLTSFPAANGLIVGDNTDPLFPTSQGTFIGFSAASKSEIQTVKIRRSSTDSRAADNWGFDQVIIIPEPSSAILLASGFVLWGFSRRRSS